MWTQRRCQNNLSNVLLNAMVKQHVPTALLQAEMKKGAAPKNVDLNKDDDDEKRRSKRRMTKFYQAHKNYQFNPLSAKPSFQLWYPVANV